LLFEHVVLAQLIFSLTDLAFILFPIEASLQSIDLTLVAVKSVSDALDPASLVLNGRTMLSDVPFKLLPFRARLELNESLLFVDSLTLLLHSFLKLLASSISISVSIGLVLLSLSLGSRWVLGLFRCIWVGTLRRSCPHLLLLHLTEGVWVSFNLPLNRLYVLLSLAILHPDHGEDLANLSQRVNITNVFPLSREESLGQLLDL